MSDQSTPSTATSNTILIVDDEKNLLLGIARRLERTGYKVLMASSGNEGLQLARQHHPDIILSDIGMPPPNGFELRQILSEDTATANIPFIFLTAKASLEDKLHGLDLGADDYITKPFDIQELLARVQAVMRRAEKGRQAGMQEAEAKVEQLRKAISTNLSHELRTPLGQIMMSLQTVMRQRSAESSSEDVDWSIQAALTSAEKLKQLVNDLILLHTIDAGEISTFRQAIDVNYEVRNPIESRVQAWKKNIKVKFGIHPDVRIYAPRLEFTQAIIHLADNAAKFAPESSLIQVLVLPNGEGGCILTMQDEGPGIPPAFREKVFERYCQLDAGDARKYGGLGVGLTIAQSVAQSLGGSIKILDSEKGCKIQLTLPPAKLDWTA
jgi:two-component system, sensor histidine kinase and response regulator